MGRGRSLKPRKQLSWMRDLKPGHVLSNKSGTDYRVVRVKAIVG